GDADILIGGVGGDTLTGGTGADTFVYADGDGGTLALADVISDFEDGVDMFDLSGTSATTFTDLSIGTSGVDAVIMVTSTSEILAVVTGADGQIDSSDFIF
ncbi:MAG: M10 family metallopeptidase C-terminal domain-containing protein, partial [Proteobacteria bacterium]|nr:M10 family metallopeptidase C-terminal domain-containing protein [Pseudomonadota bacterium]